jgi:puromycin-sensitive aminopeptidase
VNPYRLPTSVRPSRYDLTLAPDLDRRDFVGQAVIRIGVNEPIGEIVCNAADLDITKAWVVDGDGVRLDATPTLDATYERVTFALERTLRPGMADLHVQFHGTLNDKLRGFYASTYTADDGSTKVIATTQFESTDARRAFPCWDEPDCKAVFGITLIAGEGELAVSNMHEVASTVLATGKRSVRFADTPLMSSYLVALVVGELEATPPVNVDGVELRVIARPGALDQSAFALDVGAFALRYFQDWYGIPYPGSKLDFIATPDFAFGAMENLGAVTFREALLLVDEEKAARTDVERIADVVCHEIAHMWFGDLVTMKWWNGLWLNEAFATFAETSACAAYRPVWDRWTTFATSRAAAFAVDGLATTRPIEFPVVSPADAEGMFDVLTYEKGGSILRMLEMYLGPDRFRDGVRRYLRTHSFANAETTDLWDAIEEETGEPVRETMDGWIFRGGYPVVVASLDGTELSLRQEHFRYLAAEGAGDAGDAQRWNIPVLYRTSSGEQGRILLTEGSASVALSGPAEWVVVNAGGHGFYRVRYESSLCLALVAANVSLAAVERYQLVSDAWADVLAGALAPADFLSLTASFGSERDPNVWSAVIEAWDTLDHVMDDAARGQLAATVRSLLQPVLAELGWSAIEGETPQRAQLRGMVIGALGGVGDDPAVQAEAGARIGDVLARRSTVPPDVEPAVIAVAAAAGDAARYDEYLAAVAANDDAFQFARRVQFALGRFRDPALVIRTLEMSFTDRVRTQDAPFLLGLMLANRENGTETWRFLASRWSDVEARFMTSTISRMLESVSALSTPELTAEIDTFFATGPGAAVLERQKPIARNLERLRIMRRLHATVTKKDA